MKKVSILLETICLIMVLLLTGCTRNQEITDNNIVKAADEEVEEILADEHDEELPGDIPGIWLGEDGTVILIYADGKADFYYYGHQDVEEGNTWSYLDGKLTIFEKELSCDIYTTVEKTGNAELELISDSENWVSEKFKKISSVASPLTADDYRKLCISNGVAEKVLLNNGLEKKTIGQLDYYIDPKYEVTENEDDREHSISYRFGSENDYRYNLNILYSTKSILGESMYERLIDSIMSDCPGEIEDYDVLGYDAKQYICYDTEKEQSSIITFISCPNGDEFAFEFGIPGINRNLQKVVDGFFRYRVLPKSDSLVETQNQEVNDAGEGGNEITQGTTDGGTDESLREFLDEYEKFIDEYVDFMSKYKQASPTEALAMAKDYAEMYKTYLDLVNKVEAYDIKEMSAEDREYYLEVTKRCTKKMLKISKRTI